MRREKKYIFLIFVIIYMITAIFNSSGISKTLRKESKVKQGRRETTSVSIKEDSSSKSGILQIDARSALLMDGLSGEVLFEYNPDLRIPPASFVKILTLYLIFDAIKAGQIKMDDLVTVSEKAWRTQGSKMFIKVGERVRVEDLIKGIAIASGNDACVALAEYLTGSEEVFVSKMNEKAKLLGMKNSNFKNSNGLPDSEQYTTAMDMAILSKRYIEDHPEALRLHSTIEFEYNGIKQGNRNTLLQKNIGVDGLKTGHIAESGYHLVATAKRDGQRMIAVVMGCDKVSKRAQEAQKLLEYGFKNFSTVQAVKKEAPFGPIKIKWGKSKELILNPKENFWVTTPKGKENSVSVTPQLPESITAPVQKGQEIGRIIVQREGKTIKDIVLISSSDVEKSFIPPWPIILGVILGLAGVCVLGALFIRRKKLIK